MVSSCGCCFVIHRALGSCQPQQGLRPPRSTLKTSFKGLACLRGLIGFQEKFSEKLLGRLFRTWWAEGIGQGLPDFGHALQRGDRLIVMSFGRENQRLNLCLLNLRYTTTRVVGRESCAIKEIREQRQDSIMLASDFLAASKSPR